MIIINEQKNQLCNRLFAFLPSIAFALENNEKLLVLFFSKQYLLLFPNLAQHRLIKFSLCSEDTYPKGLLKALYIVVKAVRKMMAFNRKGFSFLRVSRNRNRLLFISGWRERYAPSYITKHHEMIKTLFEPPTLVKDSVRRSFPKDDNAVIIGVHVRRGDYKTYKNGIYYYSDAMYGHFMDQLQEALALQGKNVWFLLCSNESISNELISSYSIIKLPVTDHITDLHALSCCDYIIGPPSTFSQWASFIGKVPLKLITSEKEKIDLSEFNYVLSIDRMNPQGSG